MADCTELFQGDVLSRVVIAQQSLGVPIVADEGGTLRLQQFGDFPGVTEPASVERVMAAGLACEAVVVSQTCDVRNEEVKSLHVVPIVPLGLYDEGQHGLIRADRLDDLLPIAHPADSVADLGWLTTVGKGALQPAAKIDELHADDVTRLILKLTILLGRTALPDDVTAAMKSVQAGVTALSKPQKQKVHSIYVSYTTTHLSLMLVHDAPDDAKYRTMMDRWQAEDDSTYSRSATVVRPAEVTLADLAGYQRVHLDYLSFPLRMQES